MPEMSRLELTKHIESAHAEALDAIRSHPVETRRLYETTARAHEEGMNRATPSEWSTSSGLDISTLKTIHRYLFAISFMSAWYHLRGDKARRDKASHAASLLATAGGLDPEEAMRHLLRYEHAWRGTMKAAGIAPLNMRFIALFVAALTIGLTWFLLR